MTTSGGSFRGSWEDWEGEAGVGSIFSFEALEGEAEDGGGGDEEGELLDIVAVTEGMAEVTEESTVICLSPANVLTVSVNTGLDTMLDDFEKDASGRRLFDDRIGSAMIASVSFGGIRGTFWSCS